MIINDFLTVQNWLRHYNSNQTSFEGQFKLRDELEINVNILSSLPKASAKKLKPNGLGISVFSTIIYLLTFSCFYFISEKSLSFNQEFFISLGLFLLAIIFGMSLSKKIKISKKNTPQQILKALYISTLMSLTLLIIIFTALKIKNVNRNYIEGSIFIGLVIESFLFILISSSKSLKFRFFEHIKLSFKYIFIDGMILTLFCYFEIVTSIGPTRIKEIEIILLGLVYFSWLISAYTTHKFIPTVVAVSRLNAFELQVKFYLRIVALLCISMIFLQFEMSDAIMFIRAITGYSLVSSILFLLLFAEKIKNKTDEATVVFLKAFEMNELPITTKDKTGKYNFKNPDLIKSGIDQELEFEYLKDYKEIFPVLNNVLDLKSFDFRKTLIIKSDEPNDVSANQPNSYQLVVNLHNLNDQVKLNDYILNIRNILLDGGIFVGALLPHHYRYRRYLKKYSFLIANILYFLDFIWKRVMPKLPITREIYFSFSKEKDRAISLAEGLGRLVYCGFNIVNLASVDDVVYFAAVKEGVPHTENKFFYSPIFKMNRIGKNGKEIKVYKLRTMYPYAEYLQDYIVKLNGYSKIGKPANDFRLPVWGNIFRKYWIDEVPQLLNVFKGEMRLVGARPLSKKVYNDYPTDIKALRNKYKPGCIPPYVSLMMQSMEKSIEAERIYLKDKEIHPITTDFKYFFNAIYNILSRKIRSS